MKQTQNKRTNIQEKSTQEKIRSLQNLLLCSNINLDEVLEDIESMTNKKILEQHPYAITQNRDGRFSTYITDSTKPNNRRKVVKPSKELLEKEIIKIYKEREKEKSIKKICLNNFYEEWLDFKSMHTNSSAYIKTIDELWKRYYMDTPIIEIPFAKLDKYTLDK